MVNGGDGRHHAASPSCEHVERIRVGNNCGPKPDAVPCIGYVLRALSSRQEAHLEKPKDDGVLRRETAVGGHDPRTSRKGGIGDRVREW